MMGKIRPNRAKEKLAAGGIVVSLGGLASSDLIDQIGPMGLDAVWLEAEHGPVDYGHIGDLTRACDLWGMTSIVRVNSLDYGTIYRVLDLGAQAICVPHVDTADDAKGFVEAAKFAPIGRRGLFTGRQGFGVPDYLEVANDQTMLIALIEDAKAVENLDAILAVDHIDVFFVAPSDLAASMGHIGKIQHPEVQGTIDRTLQRIAAAGRTPGTLLLGHQNVARYTALGVRCFMTPVLPLIAEGVGSVLEAAAASGRR
jgi:4-hydroxy-2-oxoheptanedioate aldolase